MARVCLAAWLAATGAVSAADVEQPGPSYQVEGWVESDAFEHGTGKFLRHWERRFDLVVNGSNWLLKSFIEGSNQPPINMITSYTMSVIDGNCYMVSTTDTNASKLEAFWAEKKVKPGTNGAPPQLKNIGTAKILPRVIPPYHLSLGSFIWLAYASGGELERNAGRDLPPIFPVGFQKDEASMRFPAGWVLASESPHVPEKFWYFDREQRWGSEPGGETIRPVFPAWTNFLYICEAGTNIGSLRFPLSWKIEIYIYDQSVWKAEKRIELRTYERTRGVTHAVRFVDAPASMVVELPGRSVITDH